MIIQEYLDFLQERKRTTVSRSTRAAKIKRATGSLASAAAKKKNDPAYKKMVFHKKMWKKYKDMVMRKYAPRVRSQARR